MALPHGGLLTLTLTLTLLLSNLPVVHGIPSLLYTFESGGESSGREKNPLQMVGGIAVEQVTGGCNPAVRVPDGGYMQTGGYTGLPAGNEKWTLGAWVNIETVGSGMKKIIVLGEAPQELVVGVHQNLTMSVGGKEAGQVDAGVWFFLILKYDGSPTNAVTLYKDYIVASSESIPLNFPPTNKLTLLDGDVTGWVFLMDTVSLEPHVELLPENVETCSFSTFTDTITITNPITGTATFTPTPTVSLTIPTATISQRSATTTPTESLTTSVTSSISGSGTISTSRTMSGSRSLTESQLPYEFFEITYSLSEVILVVSWGLMWFVTLAADSPAPWAANKILLLLTPCSEQIESMPTYLDPFQIEVHQSGLIGVLVMYGGGLLAIAVITIALGVVLTKKTPRHELLSTRRVGLFPSLAISVYTMVFPACCVTTLRVLHTPRDAWVVVAGVLGCLLTMYPPVSLYLRIRENVESGRMRYRLAAPPRTPTQSTLKGPGEWVSTTDTDGTNYGAHRYTISSLYNATHAQYAVFVDFAVVALLASAGSVRHQSAAPCNYIKHAEGAVLLFQAVYLGIARPFCKGKDVFFAVSTLVTTAGGCFLMGATSGGDTGGFYVLTVVLLAAILWGLGDVVLAVISWKANDKGVMQGLEWAQFDLADKEHTLYAPGSDFLTTAGRSHSSMSVPMLPMRPPETPSQASPAAFPNSSINLYNSPSFLGVARKNTLSASTVDRETYPPYFSASVLLPTPRGGFNGMLRKTTSTVTLQSHPDVL